MRQVPKATHQPPDVRSPTTRAPERFAHVALEGGKPEILDVAGRESQGAFAQRETQGPEAATQGCDAIVVAQVGNGEGREMHEVIMACGSGGLGDPVWRHLAGIFYSKEETIDQTRWLYEGG